MQSPEEARFSMTKERHTKSLAEAIQNKKIDPLMIDISNFIAQTKNYFTTSTCSGRITLMDVNERDDKRENAFFRKWHSPVAFEDVWNGVQDNRNSENLWFRQDAFVFVIGTNKIENTKPIIQACQEAGVKRFGIHHSEPGKVLMEIFGSQRMSVPVKEKQEILVSEKYVQKIVETANKKWKQNNEKLNKLNEKLKEKLV
jgi:tRNA wybutosine-synthesizing protein 3